jgi:hypothetical protein
MHQQDTEWNDILREKGIIPEITEERLEEIVDEVIHKHRENPLEAATLNQLDELLDEELEDDRIIQQYRAKRMAELKQAQNGRYGKLMEISKTDYENEVTIASKLEPVIVLLYQSSLINSNLIERELDRIADKYRNSKILKIQADKCIKNYPDKNVPTILVYVKGDFKKQMIALTNRDVAGLEQYLRALGAIEGKFGEDEDEEDTASNNSNDQ